MADPAKQAEEGILAAVRRSNPDAVPPEVPPTSTDRRWQVLLLGLPLATGAALVLHILTDGSLAMALAGAATMAAVAAGVAVRHLDEAGKADARRRLRVGLVSGVVGLLAYDACRLGLVAAGGLGVKPLAALPHFGRGLLGESASDDAAWAAGIAYHVANGIGFAVAHCLAVRRPTWRTGVVWALLLEAAMIAFYPSWLQIEALREFVTMSVFGHLAYGVALGSTAHHLLGRRPPSVDA